MGPEAGVCWLLVLGAEPHVDGVEALPLKLASQLLAVAEQVRPVNARSCKAEGKAVSGGRARFQAPAGEQG